MSHPVVEAIKTGKAPKPARLATAKGMLPMPPEDLLEALSYLARDAEEEIRSAVPEAMAAFNSDVMLTIAQEAQTAPELLTFMCTAPNVPEEVQEALIINRATPDAAVLKIAFSTQSTSLIEALTINQQRMIRNPQLIEAILHNPKRSPESERRAREVKLEFFEKELGKQRISQEAAAQSRSTQAEAQFTVVAAPPPPPPPVAAAPPPPPPVPPPVMAAPPPPAPAGAPQKDLKLSKSPPVAMIQQGRAPKPAKLMTAMGRVPLAPEDLLHAQVLLSQDPDPEISAAARTSIDGKDPESLVPIAQNRETAEEILSYLMVWPKATMALSEALLVNISTPDQAVLSFARITTSGSLLEAVSINQQRMIRLPDLIDAVLNNPSRTFEAERLAREIRVEFFEKELGAARVAEEKRVRAEKFAGIVDTPVSEDEFETLLAEFEADMGVTISDEIPSIGDALAAFNRMISEVKDQEGVDLSADLAEDSPERERLSIYKKLAKMSVKERIFAALKGNREVRGILIRDSNKLVSSGVMKNPRITEMEVESISNIKGISEDVLRIIAMNRAWISSYNVMHNMVRNPRTPVNFTMQFMVRLQNKDLQNLGKSKGVPDMIRQAAARLYAKRKSG